MLRVLSDTVANPLNNLARRDIRPVENHDLTAVFLDDGSFWHILDGIAGTFDDDVWAKLFDQFAGRRIVKRECGPNASNILHDGLSVMPWDDRPVCPLVEQLDRLVGVDANDQSRTKPRAPLKKSQVTIMEKIENTIREDDCFFTH
mgnify:CR=1 FL=1